MSDLVTIIGYGPVGQATCQQLIARGYQVRVAQRTKPSTLPLGVDFIHCDVLVSETISLAIHGACNVVLATGFEYSAQNWQQTWPVAMANVLQACKAASARLVFADNLYMYGPQTAPLTPNMSLTNLAGKPGVRATITRQWTRAFHDGGLKVTAVRASDFYGPGAANSQLGIQALGSLTRGKPALLLLKPDVLHDFVYLPDFARAIVSLVEADDGCFGQAWHVPTAPAQTPRAILELAAKDAGRPLKLSALAPSLLPILGLFVPMLKELSEMRFQFDRPYTVDSQAFRATFWDNPTPFEIGIPAAVQSFMEI